MFVVGYYDRMADAIVMVPFQDILFTSGDHFSFLAQGDDGVSRRIPFHRVRQVYKDGRLIWERPSPARQD